VRFTADGYLDTFFGDNGHTFLDGSAYSLERVLQQADGKLIAAGSESPEFSGFLLAASRVLYDDEVGVEAIKEKEIDVTVFPNPATTQVTFTISAMRSQKVKLELINELLQPVYSKEMMITNGGTTEQKLLLEGIPSGSYIAQVTGESVCYRTKVIVCR
jgi:hypothetical protein